MYSVIIASSESANDMVSRLGVLNSLDFAMADSTAARPTAIASILAAVTIIEISSDWASISVAMPQGMNSEETMAMKMVSLIIEDSSIMASSLPEYSRTMASWTMVSSRWVAGLSKGTLAFSASRVTRKDMVASMSAGPIMARPEVAMISDMELMPVPESVRTESVDMASRSDGSISTDIIISLLLPIPPNADPPSRPPSTMQNLNMENM